MSILKSESPQEVIDRIIGESVREELMNMLSQAGKLTPEFVKEISEVDPKVEISHQLYNEIQESQKVCSSALTSQKVTASQKPGNVQPPKKPLSSYMCFCKEKRAELKTTVLSKRLASEWRSLSYKERCKYESKAVEDKLRYSNEMKEYNENATCKVVKRPVSSYMFFSKDKIGEIKNANPQMTLKEIHSELGRLWREVFNTELLREKWVKLAEADRTRYYREKSML